MRYHDRFTLYDLAYAPQALATIQPSHLVAARLEPTLSPRYEAILDVIFGKDGRYLPVGLALVEGAMLVEPESSAFSWPRWMRSTIDEATLEGLERRIEPWLQSLVLGRFENDVQMRVFSTDAGVKVDVERAAALGLWGAVPYVELMRSIAPYVYAGRFAYGKRVDVASPCGSNGAAFLSGRASSVALRTGDEETDAFCARWFGGLAFAPHDETQPYDVAIGEHAGPAAVRIATGKPGDREVPVARALPLAALVTFDPDDSILDGAFDVTVPAPAPLTASALSVPPSVGGSGGRIALFVRDDWERTPDADSDAISALRSRLCGEGFAVDVVPGSAPVEPQNIDLAHVVGKDHAAAVGVSLQRLRQARVPIVVTPFLDDARGEGLWGSGVTPFAYRSANDLVTLELYLDGLQRRRLVADNAPAPPTQSGPVFDPAVRELLAAASCVIVSSKEEERLARDAYGYSGEIVQAAPLVDLSVAADPSFASGTGDFVLVHAPMDTRTGTVAMVRAARDSGLPVLFTGPVANSEVHYFFNSYLGGRAWFVPPSALDRASLEGLYARARVYADVPWLGRGLSRVAKAASYGAGIVASSGSSASELFPQAVLADPASHADIARALQTAWERAPGQRASVAARVAQAGAQGEAFVAVVSAYAQAGRLLAVS